MPRLRLQFLPSSAFPVCRPWPRPTSEPEGVFLCSEVCVLLVPFARGQALFSVEVLRVYPNVQDLGVSARLSESGEKEQHFLSDGCDVTSTTINNPADNPFKNE